VNKIEINFFTEELTFILPQKKNIRKWIEEIIHRENKKPGILNFIFCSDAYLLDLNIKYLNHNTFTDVITFDQSLDGTDISGDIYISIDRIKENAKTFKTRFNSELNRVMCHGILHLIGYNDKTSEESRIIKGKEDYYLSLQPLFI
jgi:rRNA maturation RNase YbeY